MSLSPLTKEAHDPVAVCRHRFESVFDMHGVKTGSPEDLSGFLAKLRNDRYFAMDFWEIAESAGRVGDRGVSQAKIRETVIHCVGGPGVQDTDPEVQEIQREFNGKLPGDIQAVEPLKSGEAVEAAVQDDGDNAIDNSNISSDPGAQLPEIAPDTDVPAYTIGSEDETEEHAGTFSYSRSREMDDALARLEINSNALKLQLENIDSRMSRIEPHIEDLSSMVAKSAGRDSAGDELPMPVTDGPQVGTESVAGAAAVEGVATEKGPFRERRTAARHPVWADSRGRILAVVPVLLVMLLVVLMAWLWALQHRSHNQAAHQVGPVGADAGPSGAAAGRNPVVSAVPPSQLATTGTLPVNPRARSGSSSTKGDLQQVGAEASKPVTPIKEPPQQKKSASRVNSERVAAGEGVVVSSTEVNAALNGPVARNERTLAERSDNGSHRFEGRSERDANHAKGWSRGISVSSGVMAANLIESPPPNYPRLAKLAHVQGPVVLQVFISKDGTVDHIHAVKGHRLLRGAAKKAVEQWRYRPYVVNGRAVEVATIVTVDFRLGEIVRTRKAH